MKKIIAIMGKSGSGKDTILGKICERNPNFHKIIPCTTRPKRENEIDNVNYHFLTNEEFAMKVLNGDMLEATCFNDWHYGTAASDLVEGINIGVFNPEAFDCLKQSHADVIGYYITAADKTRVLRQLNREEFPNVHEIARRFMTDEGDFVELEYDADYVLINELETDLLNVVQQIELDIQDLGINS